MEFICTFMKIHLVKERTILRYCEGQARAKTSFKQWLKQLKKASWNIPEDIVRSLGAVDFLGNGTSRVVFDIGGNNYRMICKYTFGEKQAHLLICWIGTHAEYTELCRKEKQYTVWAY